MGAILLGDVSTRGSAALRDRFPSLSSFLSKNKYPVPFLGLLRDAYNNPSSPTNVNLRHY